jgi:hypothetical protein
MNRPHADAKIEFQVFAIPTLGRSDLDLHEDRK